MRRSAFAIVAVALSSAASLYGAAGRGFSDGCDSARWINLNDRSHIAGTYLDPFLLDGSVTIVYSLRLADVGKDLKKLCGLYGQYVGQRLQVVISLREERCGADKWKSALALRGVSAGKIGTYLNLGHVAMPTDVATPAFLVVAPSGEVVYSGDGYAEAVKAAKKALAALPNDGLDFGAAQDIPLLVNTIIRMEETRYPWAVVEMGRYLSMCHREKVDVRLKDVRSRMEKDPSAKKIWKFIDDCERIAAADPRSRFEARENFARLTDMRRKLDNMKNDDRLNRFAMVYEARLDSLISQLEDRKPDEM